MEQSHSDMSSVQLLVVMRPFVRPGGSLRSDLSTTCTTAANGPGSAVTSHLQRRVRSSTVVSINLFERFTVISRSVLSGLETFPGSS